MNSLNHSPFALVSEWFYEHLAGIGVRFGAESYRIEVAPSFVDDLSWAEGTVETPLGPVEFRWKATDEGHELSVAIPWNADAHVSVLVREVRRGRRWGNGRNRRRDGLD